MGRHYGWHGASIRRHLRQFPFFALLVLCAAAASSQKQPVDDSDSARVLALETLWNQAEVDKDASALDHLLAETFVYVDIDGSLKSKAEFLDSVKHPPERIEIIGNESLTTHVYQNAVIVTGTYHERGKLNGKSYIHHGRFTDTWVRQGSGWMCVASQSTLMQR